MRRILSFLMIIVMCICFSSCSKEENMKPKYYYPALEYLELQDYAKEVAEENGSQEMYINRAGENLSSYEKSDAEKIFKAINKEYGLKLPLPSVLKSSFNEYYGADMPPAMYVTALYDTEVKKIYMFEPITESTYSRLAHEYGHYCMDRMNEGNYEWPYKIGDRYRFGKAMREGVANYISTRVYPHPETVSIYEFETHVNCLFGIIVGEEEYSNALLKCDIDFLKSDFNEALEGIYPNETYNECVLTPYDMVIFSLDNYQMLMSMIDPYGDPAMNQDILSEMLREVNSVEEMLYFYAEKKSADKDAIREEAKRLVSHNKQIPWEKSSIKKIVEF